MVSADDDVVTVEVGRASQQTKWTPPVAISTAFHPRTAVTGRVTVPGVTAAVAVAAAAVSGARATVPPPGCNGRRGEGAAEDKEFFQRWWKFGATCTRSERHTHACRVHARDSSDGSVIRTCRSRGLDVDPATLTRHFLEVKNTSCFSEVSPLRGAQYVYIYIFRSTLQVLRDEHSHMV